jgi:hypothetical protein
LAQCLHIVAPEHHLSLKRERCNWVCNGIYQQLAPRERLEIHRQEDTHRRPDQKLSKRPPLPIVSHSRTTKLYDRRGQKVLLEDLEQILYY